MDFIETQQLNKTEDVDRACLSARVEVVYALIEEDYFRMYGAMEAVALLGMQYLDRHLPFLDDDPTLRPVLKAGRLYERQVYNQQREQEERAQYVASLPSASELFEQAKAAGESFDFAGYTFWREGGGWSLTNAYGVDYCGFLRSAADFEWILKAERDGVDIGPVPPYCERESAADEETRWWQDMLAVCSQATTQLVGPLDPALLSGHSL